jgi:hypothetical protein
MHRIFVLRQKMPGQRAVAAHDASIRRLPGGSFVMVDDDRLFDIRQDRIGVRPGPSEALIGLFAGIDLNACGQGLELKQNLLPVGVLQLRIGQRILRRLSRERP